ncbi:hypothetical protein EVAR_65463_1 [Eumeta japonica]|uniref:Uncharacterized protein n=1 Tax=Eumeta variegata TaxID=151549 RepID=A0A4C1YVR5_EUMVA|nr:hypothetical protein EVAR_65463_1 [Eumeta japonica]
MHNALPARACAWVDNAGRKSTKKITLRKVTLLWTYVVTSRDSLCRGHPSGSPVGESRADGILRLSTSDVRTSGGSTSIFHGLLVKCKGAAPHRKLLNREVR